MRDVAHAFDLGVVMAVHLGQHEIEVDDLLAALRIPQARRILDHIVADAEDNVGVVDGMRRVVLLAKSDGE